MTSAPPIDSFINSRFERECRDAVSELRAALIDLYDSCGTDPTAPQEAARQFGINKTLTWTLARLLQESDLLAAASLVPGRGSITRVATAAERCGASEASASRVRRAAEQFESMAERHVGDRAALELALDSMGAGSTEALEISRRLAFRGNSGIHGVQARARLLCGFLLPSADGDRIDLAMLTGYLGFRRLRHTPRWPLFKVRSWGSPDDPVATQRWQPIDGALPNGILPHLGRGFAPELLEHASDDGSEFLLQPGPIGNDGAFDLFRGEILRDGASRFASSEPNGDTGELGANITTPAENLVFDLIAHESLEFALDAEALVYSRIFDQGRATGSGVSDLLPIQQSTGMLPGRPPAVATPLVPGYAETLSDVADRIGCDLTACRGLRLEMRYPPLGSTVTLRFKLPTRP
ncbi:MAG: hypothetical protein ACO3EP_06460 [Phycisphaerales bacterium]